LGIIDLVWFFVLAEILRSMRTRVRSARGVWEAEDRSQESGDRSQESGDRRPRKNLSGAA
jgi:hypothetical protein